MDYLPFTFPLTDQPDHIALQALFMGFSRGHFSISDRPDGQSLSGFLTTVYDRYHHDYQGVTDTGWRRGHSGHFVGRIETDYSNLC